MWIIYIYSGFWLHRLIESIIRKEKLCSRCSLVGECMGHALLWTLCHLTHRTEACCQWLCSIPSDKTCSENLHNLPTSSKDLGSCVSFKGNALSIKPHCSFQRPQVEKTNYIEDFTSSLIQREHKSDGNVSQDLWLLCVPLWCTSEPFCQKPVPRRGRMQGVREASSSVRLHMQLLHTGKDTLYLCFSFPNFRTEVTVKLGA